MKSLTRLLSGLVLAVFALGMCVVPVLAQTNTNTNTNTNTAPAPTDANGVPLTFSPYSYQNPLGTVTIPQLVARVIGQVLPLVGALFFVMFIYGGYQWMSAGGDEGKIKKARTTLLNAIIGITIVVAAYSIVSYIITTLGTAIGT
ncbi:MAG: pilin [Patescibacteria group bacterium]